MITSYSNDPVNIGKLAWRLHDSILAHRKDHALFNFFAQFYVNTGQPSKSVITVYYYDICKWIDTKLLGHEEPVNEIAKRLDLTMNIQTEKILDERSSFDLSSEITDSLSKRENITVEELLTAFMQQKTKPKQAVVKPIEVKSVAKVASASMIKPSSSSPKDVRSSSPSQQETAPKMNEADEWNATKIELKEVIPTLSPKPSTLIRRPTRKRFETKKSMDNKNSWDYFEKPDAMVHPADGTFFNMAMETLVIKKMEEKLAILTEVTASFGHDKRQLTDKIDELSEKKEKLAKDNEKLKNRIKYILGAVDDVDGVSFTMMLKKQVKVVQKPPPTNEKGAKGKGGKVGNVRAASIATAKTVQLNLKGSAIISPRGSNLNSARQSVSII